MENKQLIMEKIRRNEDALDFLVQDVSLGFYERQRMRAFHEMRIATLKIRLLEWEREREGEREGARGK